MALGGHGRGSGNSSRPRPGGLRFSFSLLRGLLGGFHTELLDPSGMSVKKPHKVHPCGLPLEAPPTFSSLADQGVQEENRTEVVSPCGLQDRPSCLYLPHLD